MRLAPALRLGAAALAIAPLALACAPRAVPVPGASGTGPADGDTIARYYAATPAAGLARLRLRARNGHATVTLGRDDSVRVRVAIGTPVAGVSAGRCRREPALLLQMALHRAGDAAMPELAVRRDPGCLDYWTVEVPAHFAVDVSGVHMPMRVTGVAGGVTAFTDVGRVDVRVPRGPVTVVVRESGDVFVRTTTPAFEEAAVESRVGSAVVLLDGTPVPKTPQEGLGERVVARGVAGDRISVKTEVGHAHVQIDRRVVAPDGP